MQIAPRSDFVKNYTPCYFLRNSIFAYTILRFLKYYMKRFALALFSPFVALFFPISIFSQVAGTPGFAVVDDFSSTETDMPLNSQVHKTAQWIIAPGSFLANGNSTGAPAGVGRIGAVYFQIGAVANPNEIYEGFSVKMGQPYALSQATDLLMGEFVEGLSQVHYSPSFVPIGAQPGAYLQVPVQGNFIYDPSRPLVVEISSSTGIGNSLRLNAGTGIKQIWNGGNQSGSNLLRMGIDLVPALSNDLAPVGLVNPLFYCSGTQAIQARIRNCGSNTVNSFVVHWSLNGVQKNPIFQSTTLSTASRELTVVLGNENLGNLPATLKIWTSLPNNQVDNNRLNDTLVQVIRPALSGEFTINPLGAGTFNFKSLNEAILTLQKQGVCGPVRFSVAPGTYSGPFVLGEIRGTSALNTVTFDGLQAEHCTLESNTEGAVFVLNGSDYVRIRNFTIRNLFGQNPAGIALVGQTRNVFIRRNSIFIPILSGSSTSGIGIVAGGTPLGLSLTGGDPDSIQVDSNFIQGGGYGIAMMGLGNSTKNGGILIRNNTLKWTSYRGIHLSNIFQAIEISSNSLELIAENQASTGIHFESNTNSSAAFAHKIIRNTILNFSASGIYCANPFSGISTAPMQVFGNSLNSAVWSATQLVDYGIFISSSVNGAVDVFHNTVVINGGSSNNSNAALYTFGWSNIRLRNNIFAIFGGSYTPVYLTSSPLGNTINHNVYYSESVGNPWLIYRGSFFSSSNYKQASAGGDSSSNVLPSFVRRLPVANSNLHLLDDCHGRGANLRAFQLFDIDGDTFQISPSIGADQFVSPAGPNLRITRLLKPNTTIPATSDVEFEVKNCGTVPVSSYQANYRNNFNAVQSLSRNVSLSVCSSDTVRFTGATQVSLGSRNKLLAYIAQPNNFADVQPSNDTLITLLYGPLNGVYTVGGLSPDFETVKEAASALSRGVSGPVTFDIRPGTYIGQISVTGPISGANSINRIVFEGNDASNRILMGMGSGPVVLVTQAKYITFQNLSLVNRNSGIAVGFGLVNPGVSGVRIKKCRIELPVLRETANNGYGILATGHYSGTIVNASSLDSIEIDSNFFSGGAYGFYMQGSSTNSSNRGIFIRSNSFEKINTTGIFISSVFPPIRIQKNRIRLQVDQNGPTGISLIACSNSNTAVPTEISSNTIDGFTLTGITLSNPVASGTSARIRVFNNLILGNRTGKGAGGNFGISLVQNANCFADVHHNTIAMYGTTTTNPVMACFFNSGSVNTLLKNNIFVVYAGTYVPVYQSTAINTSNCNGNLYYNAVNPISGPLIFRNATFFNSTNYKSTAANGGNGSFNELPPFKSDSDFSLKHSCLKGENLLGLVPLDQRDSLRSTLPTLGAFEYPISGFDIAPIRVVLPSFPIGAGTQNLSVLVRNQGKSQINSFLISYKLQGAGVVSQQVNQTLNPCDTAVITFSGSAQIPLINGHNPIQIFTSNPNNQQDAFSENDTLLVSLSTPLLGDYTIGRNSSDFVSFNEALRALQTRGAIGPVRFLAKSGYYHESLVLGNFPGRDSSNVRISFSSLAQHPDSVVLRSNNQGSINPGVVSFVGGAHKFSFERITIENVAISSGLASACVWFEGENNQDTIRNCNLLAREYHPFTNAGTNSALILSQQGWGKGISIRNTNMKGSYLGVSLVANSVSGFTGLNLESNTISFARLAPISNLRNTRKAVVKGNLFLHNPSSAGAGSMLFLNNDSGFVFSGNRILTDGSALGINFQGMQGESGKSGLISNNIFSSTDSLWVQLGPQLVNGLKFYHNSLVLGSGALVVNGTSSNGVYLRNNIVNGTKPQIYYINNPLPANFQSDFNNVFSSISTSPYQVLGINRNLFGIRSINNLEQNSISHWPGWLFTATGELNPGDSAIWSVNGRGTHLTEVIEDINGNPRPMNPQNGVPDLGAEELDPTCPAPICQAIPLNPIAGQTQHFLFGQDTVARIVWTSGNAVPSAVGVRSYTGRKPPHLDTATAYMFYFMDMQSDTGNWNYSIHMKVRPEWRGTIGNFGSNLKLARYSMPGGWQVYQGSQSSLVGMNVLVAFNQTKGKSLFTGADDLSPLPVTLIRFDGVRQAENALLNWASSSEENLESYYVESSTDGLNYAEVGAILANGNSRQLLNYRYTHERAFESTLIRYYRLKMLDKDGSYRYSKSIQLNRDETREFAVNVYPNPFSNQVYIQGLMQGVYYLELIDLAGKVHWREKRTIGQEGLSQLDFPKGLKKGIYALEVKGDQVLRFKLLNNEE